VAVEHTRSVLVLVVKRDIILLDVNDGLAQERVGFADNDGRDLAR
jgi:hypothetical protein